MIILGRTNAKYFRGRAEKFVNILMGLPGMFMMVGAEIFSLKTKIVGQLLENGFWFLLVDPMKYRWRFVKIRV